MSHAHPVNCGNYACEICYQQFVPPADILDALNADDYRLGQLQVLQAHPPRNFSAACRMLPPDLLSQLWKRLFADHTLDRTFCGMSDISHNSIVGYLIGKPLFVPVIWAEDNQRFDIAGFGWIGSFVGIPPYANSPAVGGPRSAFAAYAYFREYWGRPELVTLALYGLAAMIRTYNLRHVFGQRYGYNTLSGRFMAKCGFKDVGTLPESVLGRDNSGVPALYANVVSAVSRGEVAEKIATHLASMLV